MKKASLPLYAMMFIASAVVLSGCQEVVTSPEPIEPLYKYLAEYNSLNGVERDSLLRVDSVEIDNMMRIVGREFIWSEDEKQSADVMVKIDGKENAGDARFEKEAELPTINETLEQWARSRKVEMFTSAVDTVFRDLKPLENTLGLILENAENVGVKIPKYRYVAVVWGNLHPIVFSDTIMFIALNHFLGEDFPGYITMQDYRKKERTPEKLPYAIAESLISNNYPYQQTENSTALSRMMYEGAMTYLKLKLVPNATLSSTLGYTSDQLEWLDSHYEEMWETVIGKDMIYSTSQQTIDKLVAPAPNTGIISPEYPGRAGRYLGYRLILNYMVNNAKTPLTYLLSPAFYNNPSELVLAQ